MRYNKYLGLAAIFAAFVSTAQAADLTTHAKAIAAYRAAVAATAMPVGFAGSDSEALFKDIAQPSATHTNQWIKAHSTTALNAAIDQLLPADGVLLAVAGLVNAPGGAGGHVVPGDATHPADLTRNAFKAALAAVIAAVPDATPIAGSADFHSTNVGAVKTTVETALITALVTWLRPYTDGALVPGALMVPATIGVGANTANAVLAAPAFANAVAAGWTGGNNVDGFVTFLTETVQNAR